MKRILSIGLATLFGVVVYAQYPKFIYMCGDATAAGWDADGKLPLYNNGDGTYEYVGDMTAGEFKMLLAKDWVPSLGPTTPNDSLRFGSHKLVLRSTQEEVDSKFLVKAGRYMLTLNMTDSTLMVGSGEGVADKNGIIQLMPDSLFLVGNGCGSGWSAADAIKMTTVAEGIYTVTTTIYGHLPTEEYNELKFLQKKDWGGIQYGPTINGEQINGAGTYSIAAFDSDLSVDNKYHNIQTQNTDYVISVNLNEATMTMTSAPSRLNNVPSKAEKAQKIFKDGKLLIQKNGAYFSALGIKQ